MVKEENLLRLSLRREIESSPGEWRPAETLLEIRTDRIAFLLCDIWNHHWCRSAARRCDEIARSLAPIVDGARQRGVVVIHAPSDCMEAYKDWPQRNAARNAPPAPVPPQTEIAEGPFPIDDSDGGCDDEPSCPVYTAWDSQHPAINIGENDWITDRGDEVYRILAALDIELLLIAGVHTNMCVINRSFGIRAMTHSGVRCALVRDATDTMYNPRRRPFVPHDEGTRLVIEHIERYLCPTLLKSDLAA